MNTNGKPKEPVICSPVLPPRIRVEVPYFPPQSQQPVESLPPIQSPAFGVKILLGLAILTAVWWICWGWELFK